MRHYMGPLKLEFDKWFDNFIVFVPVVMTHNTKKLILNNYIPEHFLFDGIPALVQHDKNFCQVRIRVNQRLTMICL